MKILTFLSVASVATSMSVSATSFEQLSLLDKDDIQIVDCRSSNFFNGWPEQGMSRGGHIQGAINIDAQWLTKLNEKQLESLIAKKNIVKDKPTYLYCASGSLAGISKKLQSVGFDKIYSIDEPLTHYPNELVAQPNYQQLVTPQWVNKVINGEKTEHAPKNGYRLVEVAWGPPAKFALSHIPTAYYLNTNNIEEEPLWNLVSDEKLTETIANLGIRYDTTVILYGRDTMPAARAATTMMYAGVEDVRLLNGGMAAWVKEGYKTESLLPKALTPVDFGRAIPAKPEVIIDTLQAKKILKTPEQSSLVSIRSWEEFIGDTSGYKYIPTKGRIDGSKWGHAGSNANSLEDFRNPDNTMRSPEEITQLWGDWGIQPQQQVSFYCGTGWRASETLFYAYVMGWENISLYDGGWFEWSEDKSNPIASGDIAPMMSKP
ncbi:rhodanese-like domain-containing protein [Aliivibrio kagoshimensis]|uniref:rhodanese-like domain-containing protein n=1 Tax=Aliivibrio kagoshimensis TaxID=2910230 RepID=UPI003D0BE8A8